jgi:multiple sugar transport system ATP-binding protein
MTLADRIVVMKHGVIQQEGSPEDLFKRPVNIFVAGFLGSPPMNFFEANVVDAEGRIELHGQGFVLPASAEAAMQIREAGLNTLTIGIRPSDLKIDQETHDSAFGLKMTILVFEYIGSQSVLVCDMQGKQVMVEIQSFDRIALNQTIEFKVSPEELYLFDTNSGAAL